VQHRSSVGRITGTLEISRPNISAARQTAANATAFRVECERLMGLSLKARARRGWGRAMEKDWPDRTHDRNDFIL
jgi:hypothetical protein